MAETKDSLETRIIELETRIAFQDRLLASLDEVVREFTFRVDSLERKVKQMQATAGTGADVESVDEPPPHY